MSAEKRGRRAIVFVPGKNPKPHPREHLAQLWRCLVEGVRRVDKEAAKELRGARDDFHLVAWNHLYYGHYKSLEGDLPWIDTLIRQPGPTVDDRRLADNWRRRSARLFYQVADDLPFLIPLVPTRAIREAIKETARYFQNRDGIADRVREKAKVLLRSLFAGDERILLIGHSMGSIIAYDSLWELWHGEANPGKVDLLLTIGSPLGIHYVRKRLLGANASEDRRYPGNIRRWINIASVGDLTALDQGIEDDFHPMLERGHSLVIHDEYEGVYNYFRNEEGLNVHRSYGYLVNPFVGRAIARWWRGEDESS